MNFFWLSQATSQYVDARQARDGSTTRLACSQETAADYNKVAATTTRKVASATEADVSSSGRRALRGG